MNLKDDPQEEIKEIHKAKERYKTTVDNQLEEALNFRRLIKEFYDKQHVLGNSLRGTARMLGITEGALRDLLRTEGTTRSQRRKRKK